MLTLKQQVVLALARAYYDREQYVQYDQRSMDRVLELTPRRRKRLPPESANSQYIQFLDCSGFTSAVYLQAFGYDLPADLTWHMVDLLERRVYYYERTYEETPEQLDAIEKEVRELLQPGDLIFTGTPEGVMHGYPADRKCWLKPGDRTEVTIAHIGTLATDFSD